jgi:hypothetical protein
MPCLRAHKVCIAVVALIVATVAACVYLAAPTWRAERLLEAVNAGRYQDANAMISGGLPDYADGSGFRADLSEATWGDLLCGRRCIDLQSWPKGATKPMHTVVLANVFGVTAGLKYIL